MTYRSNTMRSFADIGEDFEQEAEIIVCFDLTPPEPDVGWAGDCSIEKVTTTDGQVIHLCEDDEARVIEEIYVQLKDDSEDHRW